MTQKDLTLFFVWCWLQVSEGMKRRTAQQAARRKANPEKHREECAKWRRAHREERREACAQWRRDNRERYLESARRSASKRYHNNPKASIDAAVTWARENRERLNARLKVWRATKQATDPVWRVRRCLRKRIWDAVRGRAGKSARTMELVGCSAPELIAHLEKQFSPGMSWENYGKWHVDHKKPCSAFDLTDPEQQRLCFNYTNLQPLWALDNIRKGGVRAPKP
jgi:hypothetical protein